MRKISGYILTFRCVNCGAYEASASFLSEDVLPEEQITSRIYEAHCASCGWTGEFCGVSAAKIHRTTDLKATAKGQGN
jgi:transcription elongation factor Elf1